MTQNRIAENSRNIEINEGFIPENSQNIEVNEGFIPKNSQNIEGNEDFEVITQALVKMTKLTPEQIKPHLDSMVEQLRKLKETPSDKTTPQERSRAFREWAHSHDQNTPLLSDYAVSRESIYNDERL